MSPAQTNGLFILILLHILLILLLLRLHSTVIGRTEDPTIARRVTDPCQDNIRLSDTTEMNTTAAPSEV